MRLPRRTLVAVIAVSAAVFIVRQTSSGGQTLQSPSDACTGLLDAWERPEKVPSYLAWESFFDTIQSEPSVLRLIGIEGNSKSRTISSVQHALAQRNAARSSTRSAHWNPDLKPDLVVANAITNARDDLLRSLPEHVFERLQAAADTYSRQRSYRIRAPGRFVDIHGIRTCEIAVRGTEFPHLIPESNYWESYLQALAMTSAPFRLESGDYPPEHIRGYQQGSLPIETIFVRQVLRVASETKAVVDEMRQRAATDGQVAEVVLAARGELIRSLPGPVWLVVNREAGRTRAGTTYFFRTNRQVD